MPREIRPEDFPDPSPPFLLPAEGPPVPRKLMPIIAFAWMRGRRSLVEMPLDLIAIPPIWNTKRYEQNRKLMLERGSVPPVELGWHPLIRKFVIADGVHRTNAAKDLGYSSIPAIIYHRDLTLASQAVEPRWSILEPSLTMKVVSKYAH